VKGSDAFRSQVASVAGIEGLNVTFADHVLDRQRAQSRAATGKILDLDRNRGHIRHGIIRQNTDWDRGR
jgi:hypothetical protein